MKITASDVEQLRTAFAVCRVAGIDAVVVTDNQVRGVAPTSKMAIISPAKFSFDSTLKIGIGRIGEFEKRAAIFTTPMEGEGKENDKGEISILTLKAGKSSIQFRCTAERMIKYPKQNEDTTIVTIKMTKGEVQQIARAVKTLAAETLTLAIGRDGVIKFECAAPTNESFSAEITASADFEGDPQGIVHIYEGDRFASVLDAAAREADEVVLELGEYGSLTLNIKGHTLVALPNANMEDDNE